MGSSRRRGVAFVAMLCCLLLPAAEAGRWLIVELHTDGPGALTGRANGYLQGQPMPVRLVVANRGSTAEKLNWRQVDDQGGELAYPIDVSIRLIAPTGEVLTQNAVSNDEWWSAHYLRPDDAPPVADHAVELAPYAESEHRLDLIDVLRGCPDLALPLPVGEYAVELTVDGIRSSQIVIVVNKPSG